MAPNRIYAKLALILTLALFMGNLGALTDLFIHPEIPYLDEEHLIVGGITALVTGIFATLLANHVENLRLSRQTIQELNKGLERKVEERTQQLRQAQEDLVRKEKLATLGQLAATLGHELRNPLGVMGNAAYYLKTVTTGADESVAEYLNIIMSEIHRAERILADLADASLPQTTHAETTTVDALTQLCLKGCAIPEGVTLRLDLPGILPEVKVDRQQMERVFRNLVTNGLQAMPKGGDLLISARTMAGEQEPAGGPVKAGLVRISFTDTGDGIAPENMARLFQPLFTTKARGAGLGLVVSKSLVEANGGRIEVESRPGSGTTFSVILPCEVSALSS